MPREAIVWRWLPLAALLIVAGCSAKPGDYAEVKGQVLLDGKPLTTGVVNTMPTSGPGAQGVIDSQGNFTLQTRNVGPGAVLGMHNVAVVAVRSDTPNNPEGAVESLAPKRYANPYQSGLTIEVKAGVENEVTLKLSSKQG